MCLICSWHEIGLPCRNSFLRLWRVSPFQISSIDSLSSHGRSCICSRWIVLAPSERIGAKWTKFSIGYLQPGLSLRAPFVAASRSPQLITAHIGMPEVPGFWTIRIWVAGRPVSTWLSSSTSTILLHKIRSVIRYLIIVQVNLPRNWLLPNRDTRLIQRSQ